MHELYRIIEWKFGLPVAAGSVNCDEGDEYTDQDVYL